MQSSKEPKELEHLKTSDSLLHLLIDSLPAFIGYIDSDHRYVLANRRYKEFFGIKYTFTEGLHVQQVIGREAYQTTLPRLEAAFRGERQSYEYEIHHDGEAHYIKADYVPDMQKGKAKGIFVLGIDITEQKLMNQELRSAKERLEHVITSNPAVIWVGKPLPDLSDSYSTYQSKSTISITGFESEELMGEKGAAFWESRVHPDDLARYRAGTPEFWAKGYRACEYRFLHKDGTYRWIHEEANVIRDSTGNVLDIIGYWTDVTDRKRMEEELLRTNRLAAIGETAAMVGHDLRNPLQAIKGTLYLAKELIKSPKPEDETQAIALLDSLNEQVNYMNKIVSDLQDYSGPVKTKPAEMDLTKLVEDVLANVKTPENVETTLNSENVSRVTADPVLMRRIIVNLVTNAVQAMPDGGKLTINCLGGPTNFSVTVRDSGLGMAPDDAAHIFTPFFTKKAKGQGLGLAVCSRLVEAQGGRIDLESRLGHGATFTVTIPQPMSTGGTKSK